MSVFDLNPSGMMPQQAAAIPPPTGPYTDEQQQKRRQMLARTPVGAMQPIQSEGHDVPQPGTVVESQKQPDTDTSSAQGSTPTGQQPGSQRPPSPAVPANQDVLSGVVGQTQTNKPYQDPLDRAGYYSGKLQSMGAEPTWNTLPDEQKHHGVRKVLDYLGGIGAGLFGGPEAGVNTYDALAQRPLVKAQREYGAQAAPLEAGFKREIEQAKQQTSEEKAQGMEAMYQGRLATSEGLKDKYAKTITNRWQDANGNWKGQQADGTVVDTSPPTGQGRDDAGDKLNKEYTAREHEADRLGLTGTARTDFVAGDKNPTRIQMPRQPSAESEEYGDWQKQFTQDNGRPPSAQEIQNYRHPERNGPGHAKDRQTFEDHWQKQFDNFQRVKQAKRNAIIKQYGMDKPGNSLSNDDSATFKQALDMVEAESEPEKQRLQGEKDAEAEQYGVYNKQPGASQAPPVGQVKPQPTATPQSGGGQQFQTSKGVFTKNQQVNVGGKMQYVVGVGASGKPKVSDRPAP